MGDEILILLVVPIGIMGSLYVLGPVGVYFLIRQRADRFELLDSLKGVLPGHFKDFFVSATETLKDEGFVVCCLLKKTDSPASVLALMANYTTGDLAAICALLGGSAVKPYVEFCTEFAGGYEIDTNNANVMPGTLALKARKTTYQFRDARDAGELYRIHRAIMQEYAPSAREPLERREHIAEAFIESLRKEYERQVEEGMLRYSVLNGSYVPTIKGAFLMTWKLCFPVKQIREARYRKEMRAVLGRLKQRGLLESVRGPGRVGV